MADRGIRPERKAWGTFSAAGNPYLWLLVLSAVALALRLYRIDWQSSDLDENFSLSLADRSFSGMLAEVIHDVVHPPLHYMVLWSWVKLFGLDQIQSRLVSAICGTLSVPMMFLVGRRLLNARAGLIAAVLLAVSQFAVHHSQDGRMYALGFLLVLCTVFYFMRTLQDRKTEDWVLFLLFSILMLHTSYFTISVLLACAVFLLVYRREYPLPTWWIAVTPAILILALLPWLSSGVISAFGTREIVGDPSVMRFEWSRAISSLNWFNSGKWNGIYFPSPWWTIPAGVVLFTVPAFFGWEPLRRRIRFAREVQQAPGSSLLLVLLWIFPMGMVSLISWSTRTQYDVRYVVYGMAGYLLLVALGLDSLGPAAWRAVAVGATVAYSAGSLYAVYTVPYKDDFRGASRYVVERFHAGDCLCFMPKDRRANYIPYYWLVHGRSLPDAPRIPSERLTEGRYPCSRVWMLWDYAWFRNQSGRLQQMAEFAKSNYLADQQKFRGMDVVLYRPR